MKSAVGRRAHDPIRCQCSTIVIVVQYGVWRARTYRAVFAERLNDVPGDATGTAIDEGSRAGTTRAHGEETVFGRNSVRACTDGRRRSPERPSGSRRLPCARSPISVVFALDGPPVYVRASDVVRCPGRDRLTDRPTDRPNERLND